MIDKDLRYAQSHEWVRVEDDGTVTVGLSGFAIEQLGDVVYMELPSIGDSVTKGEAFGVVESVKAAADMYSPVSGKVSAVNENIQDDPDILKRDSYGDGWLMRVEVAWPGEYEMLMDAAGYEDYLKSQEE